MRCAITSESSKHRNSLQNFRVQSALSPRGRIFQNPTSQVEGKIPLTARTHRHSPSELRSAPVRLPGRPAGLLLPGRRSKVDCGVAAAWHGKSAAVVGALVLVGQNSTSYHASLTTLPPNRCSQTCGERSFVCARCCHCLPATRAAAGIPPPVRPVVRRASGKLSTRIPAAARQGERDPRCLCSCVYSAVAIV